jgi:two-component system chemotaxis response regulator CheB
MQQANKKIVPRSGLNILVVDDSAFVRQMLLTLLSQEKDFRVDVAQDPIAAMEKMKTCRPDVILLDIEMPKMDGLTFLKKLMNEDPIPTIICSGLASERTELGFRALEEGAVAIVAKPKVGVREFLQESAKVIINTIREIAHTKIRPRVDSTSFLSKFENDPPKKLLSYLPTQKIIAIGASTGGTEAIRIILQSMPQEAPGIVIVQHMPQIFTAAFAKYLNKQCTIEVKEAENGDPIISGRALIAPGDKHMMIHRRGSHYVVGLSDGPLVSRHRPSIDVLFNSVAQLAGKNAIGVVLTGMGNDGANGLLEMKKSGAVTIAQDEASSVVFGIPKEAIARGAVEHVLGLSHITPGILNYLKL